MTTWTICRKMWCVLKNINLQLANSTVEEGGVSMFPLSLKPKGKAEELSMVRRHTATCVHGHRFSVVRLWLALYTEL